MEYNSRDIDVIHLLKKLKDSSGVYPQEMLVSRRQGYLKQVAEIGGAAQVGGRQYNFSPEKVNNAEKLCKNLWGRPQQKNH
jgi:hypothetical protein